MTKKELQQLVSASYTKNMLDEKKVTRIASLLKRKDLKAYVRAVKLTEKKNHVTVAVPSASVYNKSRKLFLDIYPGKTISVEEDKLLLLGAKVQADDMVYDFSLRKRVEDLLGELEEHYDEE